jgi:hypothetical protein
LRDAFARWYIPTKSSLRRLCTASDPGITKKPKLPRCPNCRRHLANKPSPLKASGLNGSSVSAGSTFSRDCRSSAGSRAPHQPR